jgi:16S rRNA processing protein RimM
MTDQSKPERELPEFVVIGYITKPHGIKGALKVEPITDDPGRFNQIKKIFLTQDEETRFEFSIDRVQVGPKYVIISLDEITERNEAEKWKNAYIEIPREKVLPLPKGQHYFYELIGLMVRTNSGENIGPLVDVLSYPEHDVYVVESGLREILIPAAPEIVLETDITAGTITINPIEGLLD